MKYFGEIVSLMGRSADSRSRGIRISKLCLSFVYISIFFKKFSDNNPYAVKILLITLMIIEFSLDALEFFTLPDTSTEGM